MTHPVELIHLSYRRESGSSGDDPDLSAIAARRRSLGAVGLAKSDSTLIGTRVHPFWSVDRNAWVDMGDLQPGEHLRLLDGSFATVTRVQVEHAPCADPAWQPGMAAVGKLGTQADTQTGTFTTYNFEVAKWHTYFTAPVGSCTHQAIWVHNLNVGPCNQAAKDFIKNQLHGSGLSRAQKRAMLDEFLRRQSPQTQRLLERGLIRAEGRAAEVLGGIERSFASSAPKNQTAALKIIENVTRSAGLEPGVASLGPGGAVHLKNVGGLVTVVGKQGDIVIMRGSQILLRLVP